MAAMSPLSVPHVLLDSLSLCLSTLKRWVNDCFCYLCRSGGRYRDERYRAYEDRQKPATEYGSQGYYEMFY